MTRSLTKWIERGEETIQKNIRDDMNWGEMDSIRTMADNGKDTFNLIRLAFLFGVSVGNKIAKRKGA